MGSRGTELEEDEAEFELGNGDTLAERLEKLTGDERTCSVDELRERLDEE